MIDTCMHIYVVLMGATMTYMSKSSSRLKVYAICRYSPSPYTLITFTLACLCQRKAFLLGLGILLNFVGLIDLVVAAYIELNRIVISSILVFDFNKINVYLYIIKCFKEIVEITNYDMFLSCFYLILIRCIR